MPPPRPHDRRAAHRLPLVAQANHAELITRRWYEITRLRGTASDQQAHAPARGGAPVGQVGPVVEPRSLGPIARAQAPPALRRDLGEPGLDGDEAEPLPGG